MRSFPLQRVALAAAIALAPTVATAQCGPNGCFVPPTAPQQQTPSEPPPPAIRAVLRSVARIVHRDASGASMGSGTLIATDATRSHFLTCAHLFDGPGRTSVELGGATLPARVIAMDRAHDLTLLETPPAGPRPVEVHPHEPRGPLTACGFGSTGVLRCVRGAIVGLATAAGASAPSVRIRGSVRSGDSGGPVFDDSGSLVAVVWGQRDGESFAMGGEPLRRLLERLPAAPRPLTPIERLPAAPPSGVPADDAWRDEIESRLDEVARRPAAPNLPDDLARRDDLNRLSDAWEHRLGRLEVAIESPGRGPTPALAPSGWPRIDGLFTALAVGGPLAAALWAGKSLFARRIGSDRMPPPGRPIAIDSPPPPQQVTPETHYVPYERDEYARAHQWACEQLARKFPGSVEMLTSLDSLIRQQLNARPRG